MQPATYSHKMKRKMDIKHLLMLLLLVKPKESWAQTTEAAPDRYLYDTYSQLVSDLLDNYKTNVIPVQKHGHPVEVKFGLALQNIEQMDENSEIMSSMVWLNMEWRDHRLIWNTSQYGNIKSLRIPPDNIWVPDILPYNVARPQQYDHKGTDAVVYYDGTVTLIPIMQLHTYCAFDLEYYPFDQQVCAIKFGSWTYDGTTLNLTARNFNADISTYSPNRQWDLIEAPAKRNVLRYECCEEDYIDYTVRLRMKRRPGILFHVYLGPAICTVLMIPVVFLLPPESNHKIVLGGSLLISQVLILTMLPDSIPAAYYSPPLILLFYLASIVLLCLSLACSAVVINMWSRAKRGGSGVPVVLNRIFLGIFGRLVCVRRDDFYDPTYAAVNADEDNENLVKDYSHVVVPAEWRQLAMVFDRLLLILFFITCLILVIVMFSFHPK